MVADLPEERLRQSLLQFMIEKLGYPKSSLAVEVSLSSMPHLKTHPSPLPSRRADILCYCAGDPLLLIECKEAKPNEKVWQQVFGYNYYVQAPFVAIASPIGVEMSYLENGESMKKKGLYTYEDIKKFQQKGNRV